jgi:hypothetical protein
MLASRSVLALISFNILLVHYHCKNAPDSFHFLNKFQISSLRHFFLSMSVAQNGLQMAFSIGFMIFAFSCTCRVEKYSSGISCTYISRSCHTKLQMAIMTFVSIITFVIFFSHHLHCSAIVYIQCLLQPNANTR